MSRAFMKDPEPGEPRCPGCGGLGDPVGSATLDAHVAGAPRTALGGSAFYCSAASCRTAYFNAWGAAVAADQLARAAWPKAPEAPICSCFGTTAAEVVADAREGRKDRVRALVERSKGPDARCTTAAPDGACCVTRVLRLFRESFDPGTK